VRELGNYWDASVGSTLLGFLILCEKEEDRFIWNLQARRRPGGCVA